MPKLTIEISTPQTHEKAALLALPLADAAGRLLGTAPGETQVQVIRRDVTDALNPGQLPIYASLEMESIPNLSLKTLLAFELADEIAQVMHCPTDAVHVLFVPRVAS